MIKDPSEPVLGEVVETEWIAPGTMLATVSTENGTFVETYEHQATEKVDD